MAINRVFERAVSRGMFIEFLVDMLKIGVLAGTAASPGLKYGDTTQEELSVSILDKISPNRKNQNTRCSLI